VDGCSCHGLAPGVLFLEMLDASQQEYARLDARFGALTASEQKIGVFEKIANRAPEVA